MGVPVVHLSELGLRNVVHFFWGALCCYQTVNDSCLTHSHTVPTRPLFNVCVSSCHTGASAVLWYIKALFLLSSCFCVTGLSRMLGSVM